MATLPHLGCPPAGENEGKIARRNPTVVSSVNSIMTITTSLTMAFIAIIPVSISAQQLGGEVRQVPIGDYVSETFWIVSPSSEESLASRINLDMADKQDNVPAPTPGYIFSSRILVETSDLAFLGDFAHGIDSTVEISPLEFLTGFAVINTSSVDAACEMASALAEYYGPRNAYVDVDQPKHLRTPALAINGTCTMSPGRKRTSTLSLPGTTDLPV